jgi:hypothetical protein
MSFILFSYRNESILISGNSIDLPGMGESRHTQNGGTRLIRDYPNVYAFIGRLSIRMNVLGKSDLAPQI